MNPILIFVLGMLAGGLATWFFLRTAAKKHSNILSFGSAQDNSNTLSFGSAQDKQNAGMFGTAKKDERAPGLIERQAKEKEENKRKILEFFEPSEKISNNDVEKTLGVSDATATRYLDELEAEKKIRQVGKTGSGVYYEKMT